MTPLDVAAVYVDQLTAMVGVHAHELRHRSRRVAEVREEPARKLTIDVGRHLGGVAVTAEVKWVNHNMVAGREISKRPVTQVESCEKCHPVVINALFRHYSTTSPPPKTKGLFRA